MDQALKHNPDNLSNFVVDAYWKESYPSINVEEPANGAFDRKTQTPTEPQDEVNLSTQPKKNHSESFTQPEFTGAHRRMPNTNHTVQSPENQ